jgi:hypothetical protein
MFRTPKGDIQCIVIKIMHKWAIPLIANYVKKFTWTVVVICTAKPAACAKPGIGDAPATACNVLNTVAATSSATSTASDDLDVAFALDCSPLSLRTINYVAVLTPKGELDHK